MDLKFFRRAAPSILLLVAAAATLRWAEDAPIMDYGAYILGAIALGVALALPWRAALVFIAGCAIASGTLVFVNDAKMSLTEMPLMLLDLRIAFANPGGFLGAMKISWPPVLLGAAALVMLAMGALSWSLRDVRGVSGWRVVALRAAPLVVAATLASHSWTQYGERLEAAVWRHEYADIANMPDGLLLIAKKIGALPFLALSARYDSAAATPYKAMAAQAADAPLDHLPRYLRPLKAPARSPDIVVVLLESTFNLPRVFDVTPPLRSDYFPGSQQGQLQGELGVNAIGGGTWISEFEAITGVPSRLFGYAGYYTHVELAPYVRASLATHLRVRGYQTLGLYPVEGKFYGGRAAYAHYGFDAFHDGDELGVKNPWNAEDADIMERYVKVIKAVDGARPLFAFALTMENHSPHPCTRFGGEQEMPYRFTAPATPRATCELNEYIARFRSTELALKRLEGALREREKATGRPFVLAVFGDHQPNSFTGTAKTPFWTPEDYSKLRRAPNDITFYQIRSSAPSPFAAAALDIPIVMLPTLLSAYVAGAPEDIYLPGNFAIQNLCGEKITLPRLNAAYGKDAALPANEIAAARGHMPAACQSALIAARGDYDKLIEMP